VTIPVAQVRLLDLRPFRWRIPVIAKRLLFGLPQPVGCRQFTGVSRRRMIVLSHLRQAVIAVALGLFALIAFLYWSYRPRRLNEPYLHYAAEQWKTIRSGNLLERESRRIAGSAALDCGRVRLDSSATKLNQCVANVLAEKRAFKASWQILAVDGAVEDGLLGTSDGRVYQFQYLEGPYVPNWRSVRISECQKPVRLRTDIATHGPYCY
jgi:hypothetical protein